MTDEIERELILPAPPEQVWEVITSSGFLADEVELDLRPGGRLSLRWNHSGTYHGRVERVEPPRFFSFRWALDPDRELQRHRPYRHDPRLRPEPHRRPDR